jgi:hypothetical protein
MPRSKPVPAAMMRIVLVLCAPTCAQGANFLYQGQLEDHGLPAQGRYDLRITAYDAPLGGSALAAPIEFPAVEVVEGRFELQIDLPRVQSASTWFGLEVRDAGSSTFTPMLARDKALATSARIGACWSSSGDSGTDPNVNFLGTTDAQPLVLRAASTPSLRLEPSAVAFNLIPVTANVIAGSYANVVSAGARGATIAGGGLPGGNTDPDFVGEAPNRVTDSFGSVGGGFGNRAGDAAGSTLDATLATVAGGWANTAGAFASSVLGGEGNSVTSQYGSIAGGQFNAVPATAPWGVVAGGASNLGSGSRSVVSGGAFNTASGFSSSVAGGENNCAGGNFSYVGGRAAKVRPGSNSGAVGTGCEAVALSGDSDGDNGTFVWADSTGLPFVSTGANQFLIRAAAGVGINTNTPAAALTVSNPLGVGNTATFESPGNTVVAIASTSAGRAWALRASNVSDGSGFWIADSGTPRFVIDINGNTLNSTGVWQSFSDARLKQDIRPIDSALDTLLKLQGRQFEYRDPEAAFSMSGSRMGFIAQEVREVLPQWVAQAGNGYLTVSPVGLDALMVEALRALRDETFVLDEAQAERIARLERTNDELEAAIAALQRRIAIVEAGR